jgi:prepilin-type N-terminal cleavage/methylation domain-containing protein
MPDGLSCTYAPRPTDSSPAAPQSGPATRPGTSPSPGFTLVELSIVLVIVGLIAGGILVGKDLIAISEAQSQLNQLQSYETAFNTFRLKYNCLPGDCLAASQFNLNPASGAGAQNGEGNGMLPNTRRNDLIPGGNWFDTTSPNNAYELPNAWHHLQQANLIRETVTPCCAAMMTDAFASSFPKARLGSTTSRVIASTYYGTANYFYVATYASVCGVMNFLPQSMTPAQVFYSDTKTDDGKPYTGKVMNLWGSDCIGWGPEQSGGGPLCASAGGYTLTTTDQVCGLVYRATF